MNPAEAFDLRGRAAIVTGGAGDIGAAITTTLARAGAAVVVADLDADAASAVADRIVASGGRARGAALDVSQASQVDALVSDTVRDFGGLDVMVNNAGILRRRPVMAITPAEFQQVLAVNLHGVLYGCQAAGRVMKADSVIVNTASAIIDQPSAERASYAVSKGGVVQLTRGFALELGPRGIRVNGVAPGWVVSGITRQDYIGEDGSLDEEAFAARVADCAAGSPLNRVVDPEDIAFAVLYLASAAGRAYTGQILRTNGGSIMV